MRTSQKKKPKWPIIYLTSIVRQVANKKHDEITFHKYQLDNILKSGK